MVRPLSLSALLLALTLSATPASASSGPLDRPVPGSHSLRLLSPTWAELSVYDEVSAGARPPRWDFVNEGGDLALPPSAQLSATVDGETVGVRALGFRRRAVELRRGATHLLLGSHLILALAAPAPDGARVTLTVRSERPPALALRFEGRMDPLREAGVIHTSQAGHEPAHPKLAFVGRALGGAGELPITARRFSLVDADSGEEAFSGPLTHRPDQGHPFAAYQAVWQADFSEHRRPGRYRVRVSGYGASAPLTIQPGAAAGLARAFALGLVHQRCGQALELPHTRFTRPACHVDPVAVPTPAMKNVAARLAGMSKGRQGAPLHALSAAHFPIVAKGPLPLRGGHHDAGDYGRYTIMSALTAHHLLFAVDALPGVAARDDLGTPESGDGVSDLLHEALWEGDLLLGLQDEDGGFFFMVQPRDRPYEHDVLPQDGDPLVVFPKTTSATAAAVGALAELGSSPRVRAHDAARAARYLEAARAGWRFLERAWARFGMERAYQGIHHYGDVFADHDERIWAATSLYLATGDAHAGAMAHEALVFDAPTRRRWGWWRLFEGWGAAYRSCAFAPRVGRPHQLAEATTQACRRELLAGAEDVARRAAANAYGTPLPLEDKRFRNAGWYFSSDAAFDLVPALALTPERDDWLRALVTSLAFEVGANPSDQSFVSGVGRRQPAQIVHQVAMNDHQRMPPTGLPYGNLVTGIPRRSPLGRHAASLTWPRDDHRSAPYAPYDRSSDVFNVTAEPVTTRMARSLTVTAWLMATVTEAPARWRPATLRILRRGDAAWALESADPLDTARVLWEFEGKGPVTSGAHMIGPADPRWVEVEVQWPDGRRAFARWTPPPAPAPAPSSRSREDR
jgi:hypothetical protein